MSNPTEKRGLSVPVEVRDDDDGTVRVEGYAAVFGEEADIGGYFREVVARGAFDGVLGDDDTVFLINHGGLPLARTRSGTLKLSVDERGLKVESTLDASDPDVERIVPKMKRGDLDKMSFAFSVAIQEWDDTKDPPLRTIKKVERLYDVSIVTEPAYEGTEIALRSLERHRKTSNFRAANRRLRLKKNLDLRMVQRKA